MGEGRVWESERQTIVDAEVFAERAVERERELASGPLSNLQVYAERRLMTCAIARVSNWIVARVSVCAAWLFLFFFFYYNVIYMLQQV